MVNSDFETDQSPTTDSVYAQGSGYIWSNPSDSSARSANAVAGDVISGMGKGDYRLTLAQQQPYVPRTTYRGPAVRRSQSLIDDQGRKVNIVGRTHTQTTSDTYKRGMTASRRMASMGDYQQEFFQKWDDPKFRQWFTTRAVAAGIVPQSRTIDDYWNAWNKLGESVAGMVGWSGTPEQYLEFIASGKKLTPQEIDAAMAKGSQLIDPATGKPYGSTSGAPGAEPVNPISTTTSTSVASLNPLAANAAVNDLAKALLGRMPSKAELRRYRRAMNGILSSNPTVTTTTTDQTDPNNVKVSTRTKDGASAQDAVAAMQDRIEQSSEGRAFGVGKAFEDALRMMGN